MKNRSTQLNSSRSVLLLMVAGLMCSPLACGGSEDVADVTAPPVETGLEQEVNTEVQETEGEVIPTEETEIPVEAPVEEEEPVIQVTPDNLIESVSTAVCEVLESCCNSQDYDDYFYTLRQKEILVEAGFESQLPPNVSRDDFDCQSTVAAALTISPFGPWIQAVNDGLVNFDAEEATACLAELTTATCGVEATTALFNSECYGLLPPYSALAPRRMFERFSAPGETCIPLTDGVGGAIYGTCDPFTSWCCREREDGSCGLAENTEGTCVAVSMEGQECGLVPTMQFCASGLDCGISTCEKVVTEPLATGDVCYADFTLLGICTDGYCDMFGTGICESFKADGATCITSDECDSGSCLDGVCGESLFCTTVEDPQGAVNPGNLSGPVDADAMEVARLLTGTFNSNAQSLSDPAYYDISLTSCLVRAPEYGNLVLYVEQASSETLNQPYRQRLYVITAENGTVRSEIWAPKIDVKWTGLCNKEEITEIDGDQFTLRDGCDVWLTADSEGFTGSTDGKGCSSSLGGASYATSEVTLTESLLQSWDQGFDSNDIQVWGATAGPYNFDRMTDIIAPADWAAQVQAQL